MLRDAAGTYSHGCTGVQLDHMHGWLWGGVRAWNAATSTVTLLGRTSSVLRRRGQLWSPAVFQVPGTHVDRHTCRAGGVGLCGCGECLSVGMGLCERLKAGVSEDRQELACGDTCLHSESTIGGRREHACTDSETRARHGSYLNGVYKLGGCILIVGGEVR